MAPVQTAREEQGLAAPRGVSLVPRGSRAGHGLSTAAHGCSPLWVCPGIPQKDFFFCALKAVLGHLKAWKFEAHQVLATLPRWRGGSEQ